MRACKFYTPAAGHMESHDGLQLSSEYDFDKALRGASCVNQEMVRQNGGGSFTGCGFEAEQVSCPLYEPDPLMIMRWVGIDSTPKVSLSLCWTRVKFGIVEYYITLEKDDEEFLYLHQINAHEYGEGAEEFAREIFDYELEQRKEFDQHELDIPTTTESYLREVIHEVRATV